MPTFEKVYTGYENQVTLELLDKGVAATGLETTTKAILIIGGQSYDSVANPTVFDLSDLASAIITLKLGGLGLTKTPDLGRLILIMPAYPTTGLVWGDISLKVL